MRVHSCIFMSVYVAFSAWLCRHIIPLFPKLPDFYLHTHTLTSQPVELNEARDNSLCTLTFNLVPAPSISLLRNLLLCLSQTPLLQGGIESFTYCVCVCTAQHCGILWQSFSTLAQLPKMRVILKRTQFHPSLPPFSSFPTSFTFLSLNMNWLFSDR